MKKIYGTWIVLTLVIVVVALYHLYASTEKYFEDNILGVPTDQNAIIPGTLTVTSKLNNVVGRSLFPDEDGDVQIIPQQGKNVIIGERANMNLIGDHSGNRLGPHTWLPYTDKNSYIRSGSPNGDIHIGDFWAKNVSIGANGANNRIGLWSWMPYSDGNTYIRPGKTNGSVNVGDWNTSQLNIGNNGSQTRIRGRIQLGEDQSDPYHLEKIISGGRSSLRLTINDDADEALEVWGNSCAVGNCGGPGARQHILQAEGTARHAKRVCAGTQCLNESDIRQIKRTAGLPTTDQ